MTPAERNFLTAVVRFQTLVHAGVARSDPERFYLECFLGTDGPHSTKDPSDRRRFRRFPSRLLASARVGDRSIGCMVVDVGGGGMRVRPVTPLPVSVGDALVMTVSPPKQTERIDLAVEVRCIDPAGKWVGVEFVAAPLTLRHHSRAAHASAGCKSKTQEVRAAA